MPTKTQKYILGLVLTFFVIVSLWIWVAVPQLQQLSKDFSYRADIISLDNFYDEQAQKFSGETRSVTKFSYEAIDQKDSVLTIKNIFTVHKVTGETVFTVERFYGIDSQTGKHVVGSGDRDRDGYLFAPRHLKKGEPFTYWHINYDGPARMIFAGEEVIDGLTVYRYETHFEGVNIDQTKSLSSLPGVGVTRGIELEPYLQIWIEPVSGHLVKYKDDTVAYFYDLQTHTRLHPWNHFGNTYTSESISEHVQTAKRQKFVSTLLDVFVPTAFVLVACIAILFHFRRNKVVRYISIGALIVAVAVGAIMWFIPAVTAPKSYTGPVETIRLAAEKGFLASSVWVAEHNGYFKDQGLNVEITEFPSGRAAITSLFKDGNLDMATVAQTPIVSNSFIRNDYAVIAGMVTSPNDVKILARKDRNINTGGDLKGKRVGVTKGSTGHYFLSLFLAKQGLGLSDVTVVDIEASTLPEAIADGTVDAISSWEPHIHTAKKTIGANALYLESKGIFREDFYFVVFRDWAKKNPERLKRYLIAIDKAATFIAEHPHESQRIVAERLSIDRAFVASVWQDYSFKLFLDQAILLTFEQQARWMIANQIADKVAPLNYLDFIYFDALETAKPDAVTIIR